MHLHKLRDMDTHYIIDPITMEITNSNTDKNKLMLGDHDSEIYTFEIPKEVEGHDMRLCNLVEIHFINIDTFKTGKSEGVYLVNDLVIAEETTDTLVFSWKISGKATMYAGSLNFRIKFACTDEEGNYTYKKWTAVYKGIAIDDGFDNGAVVEEECTTDIIAQWEARINAISENASNVLKGVACGEVVSVNDVSPITHNMKIKLINQSEFNKNVKLIKYDKNLLTGNIIKQPNTWTVDNGVYSSSCNERDPLTLEGSYLEAGKEYVISVDVLDFILNYDITEVYRDYVACLNYVKNNYSHESGKLRLNALGKQQLTFTPTVSGKYNLICFGRSRTHGSVKFTNPQIMLKESISEYNFNEFNEVDNCKSTYPSFVLTTDTAGARIECEYNRDINKAFAELQQAIISLGGNV